MGKKKRHHYIPQFYLESFTDPRNEPYIWVYEKRNPNVRKAKAVNIAFEKHYYSYTLQSGEKDTETLENALADLENRAAPILQKIKNEETLSEQEKEVLSYFIAYSMTRVPNYRKNIEKIGEKIIKKSMIILASDRERFKSTIKGYEKKTGKKTKVPIEDFIKAIMSKEIDVKTSPEFSLGMMGIAKELAPIFYRMRWAFLRATDEYRYVTSDNPLYFFDPTNSQKSFNGVGLLNENIEVCFPISSEIMLLGNWKNYRGYFQLKNKHVREINRRTVIFALRFVFSSRKSSGISTLVKKYKDSHPKIIAL